MTDAQQALAQVREALSAGPTPGPWHHCQPFQSVRAERTIHGPVPAQRVDFVSTKTQPVHERIIIPMAGKEAHVRSEDMVFIAACNPTNIAAILAHVEAQAAEIERLRDLLRVEQALALRQDPFRCYDIECEWFGRPVRAGDCQCHHLQATTHRANVRDALANRSSDE